MRKLRDAALWSVLFALGMLVVSWAAWGRAGAAGENLAWYISRAAGLSAYAILWLNMALGLAIRQGAHTGALPRWRLYDLHQFTAPVALGLLTLHVLALLWDRYVGFTLPQVLIPMLSAYRPLAVALGIIGLYLLVLVTLSSYLERRLGYRTWRALHHLSVPAYLLSLYHAVLSGTDSGALWAVGMYLASFLMLAYLANRRWRWLAEGKRTSKPAGGI